MSGPARNPDKINTIGVVVVGICGAVLVYVSIVALQAFYMNDSSEIQTMADYGGNDTGVKSVRTAQMHTINEIGSNPVDPKNPKQTFHTNIESAIKIVANEAKVDPANLVPVVGRSEKPTIQPIFGRPKPLTTTPPPSVDPAGAGAGSDAGAGAGSGSGGVTPAPMVPTGSGTGPGHVGGVSGDPVPTMSGKDITTPNATDGTRTDKKSDKKTPGAAKGNGK